MAKKKSNKNKTFQSFMAMCITGYGFWNVIKGISEETTIDIVVVIFGFLMLYLIWKS